MSVHHGAGWGLPLSRVGRARFGVDRSYVETVSWTGDSAVVLLTPDFS